MTAKQEELAVNGGPKVRLRSWPERGHFGVEEKKMKKALDVRAKIETFANKQLEKAKKVHAENPRKAKRALEAIASEFMGLSAAEEARKLLG